MNPRTIRAVIATIVVAGLLSACGPGYQDLPLPGSSRDGDTYRIEAAFDDALNLSDGALVKIGGLPIGHVSGIHADGFHAVADLQIQKAIALHRGATARLRYDTPLGEVFVELTNPAHGPALPAGTALGVSSTSTAPSVEDSLAEASLLVNGGGLTEIQTIVQQLNDALGGREATVRSVIARANTFLKQANASRGDVDALLRALSGAGRALSARREVLGASIRALGPMARALTAETPSLNELLVRSNAVVDRTNHTLAATQDQMVELLRQLGPVLQEVLSTEPSFAEGLNTLAAADARLGQAVPGDFVPLDVLLRVDVNGLLPSGSGAGGAAGGSSPGGAGSGSTGGRGTSGGGVPAPLGGLGTLLDNLLGGHR